MAAIKLDRTWRDYQYGEVVTVLNETVCAAWVEAGIAHYVDEIERPAEEPILATVETPEVESTHERRKYAR